MVLNIKKSNLLQVSSIEENANKIQDLEIHPFNKFKLLLENSWKIKNNYLSEGEKKQKNLRKSNENKQKQKQENLRKSIYIKEDEYFEIKLTFDELTNKSFITYIDSPWGSGKTYFIENLILWINSNKIKFNFKAEQSSYLSINIIDAWEIYNSSNIEDFLINAFEINLKELKNFFKQNKLIKINEEEFKSRQSNLLRINFLSSKKIFSNFKLDLNYIFHSDFDLSDFFDKDVQNLEEFRSLNDVEKFKLLIYYYIETKYENNNKMIIIDNIERLNSKNRLDIINTILNWANLSGTTYIFLTNFDKIKITKEFEEDFWNKIALQETFKLENDWKVYIEKYKHNSREDQNLSFKLENYNLLKDLLINIFPIFFNSNKDNMDLREIKKILDNWNEKFKSEDTRELIISFIKEIEKNLHGLDKYFFINKIISILSMHEKYWNLFNDELMESCFQGKSEVDLKFQPLISNKMIRIQSNFYNLSLKYISKGKEEKKIGEEVSFDKFNLRNGEEKYFKSFNNFIDEHSAKSFKTLISNIFETIKIGNYENDLIKYLKKRLIKEPENNLTKELENNLIKYVKCYLAYENKLNSKKIIKYFEFKDNNIRKIHIYNLIFNDNKSYLIIEHFN